MLRRAFHRQRETETERPMEGGRDRKKNRESGGHGENLKERTGT